MLGIGGKKRETRAPRDASAIADVVLQDSTGADVRLGDLWAERPAVLVFLRHYG
jgi:hypothetical protein